MRLGQPKLSTGLVLWNMGWGSRFDPFEWSIKLGSSNSYGSQGLAPIRMKCTAGSSVHFFGCENFLVLDQAGFRHLTQAVLGKTFRSPDPIPRWGLSCGPQALVSASSQERGSP